VDARGGDDDDAKQYSAKFKARVALESIRGERWRLVEPEHGEIRVRRQCDLWGVNRSGLYYRPVGESAENLMLMRWIDEQYTRRPFDGSRRMTMWLREQGYTVNRERVARLMEVMGIEAVYPQPKRSQPVRAERGAVGEDGVGLLPGGSPAGAAWTTFSSSGCGAR